MQPEIDPDPEWVAALSGAPLEAATAAIEEARQQQRLFGEITNAQREVGRRSYVEIDAPLELHALVRILHPRHVVEVGVSSGVSTAYLLNALALNGHGVLHSVDLPSYPRASRVGRPPPQVSWTLPPGRRSGWAIPSRLRRPWDLRLGDKAVEIPRLVQQLASIDFFLYDVPHADPDALREFRLVDSRFDAGGVAIADHGPGGGRCPALAAWGRRRRVGCARRSGLGLFGIRVPPGNRKGGTSRKSPRATSTTHQPGSRRSRSGAGESVNAHL